MNIVFKWLSMRNFMSFANDYTIINLNTDSLTSIMGRSYDMGGENSRNGAGKSTIGDAIAFALYGKSLRGISNQKLIHKWISRNQSMIVELNFTVDDNEYLIQRGEKPSILRLFKKSINDNRDILLKNNNVYVFDISRNKNETTEEIQNILNMDFVMFQFLVVNSSKAQSFMNMNEPDRKDLFERLFNFKYLTDRAEELKEERKLIKNRIIEENAIIQTTKKSNERINNELQTLKIKSEEWIKNNNNKKISIQNDIITLKKIDVNQQIKLFEEYNRNIEDERIYIRDQKELINAKNNIIKSNISINNDIIKLNNNINKTIKDIDTLENNSCPTCNQRWHDSDEHKIKCEQILINDSDQLLVLEKNIKDNDTDFEYFNDELTSLTGKILKVREKIINIKNDIIFDNIQDIYKIENEIIYNEKYLKQITEETNPYIDTISNMSNTILIHYDDKVLNELNDDVLHYDIIINLLSDKNSYLRRNIINKWLIPLNFKINNYLENMSFPFSIEITPELSICIKRENEEFDWGNLSAGQQQRVTIAMNFSFRDLFEALNNKINFMMIDELLDDGLCPMASGQILDIIKNNYTNKNIFITTHRMDISDKIDNTLYVNFENKISNISKNDEILYVEPAY